MRMSSISKKKLIEKYHRRFANGEQYIKIDLAYRRIIEIEKDYYWQERGIFNHIKPILKSMADGLSDDEIYGEHGLVSMLIPYQQAYNAIKNREIEYINRNSLGVLFVEDGSVDVDEIQDEGITGGKIIVYRQGSHAPKIDGGNLDTHSYIESAQTILKEMYHLAETICYYNYKAGSTLVCP